MFIKSSSGEIFNELIKGKEGSWIISYENPSAPMYIENAQIDLFERVEPPKQYVRNMTLNPSRAVLKRLDMIQNLLKDDRCIIDSTLRNQRAESIAKEYKTTRRRILSLYLKYLATGGVLGEKPKPFRKNIVFDSAIRKYYFSAKKNSLKTTYELMILENYMNDGGSHNRDIPSFSSFRQYYYRHWNDNKQKNISRNGLSNYQRNERMLYGSAMAYRDVIGSYQLDETMGDIYLVSRYDRSKVIGRPCVYLAVDTVTGVIAGVYVGFEAGELAMMSCIANSAIDKVSFCKEFDIDISVSDWPCKGLPNEIICDRGREFIGTRAEELCYRYGIIINSEPPFRAELKPIIERLIGMIQDSYKSLLQSKGIINPDVQERWATDYRKQAILTIEEYSKIVLIAICTLNKGRVLENIGHLPADAPNTPLSLWNWFVNLGKTKLLSVDEIELYIRSLPRTSATITRLGIMFNKLRYVPMNRENVKQGKAIEIAYDEKNVSKIYVVKENGEFSEWGLADSCNRYKNYSSSDIAVMKMQELEKKKEARENELALKVEMRKRILNIIDGTMEEKDEV